MNIHLLFAIAFTFFLPSPAFDQKTVSAQPSENNLSCPNFPTPVIKPDLNENKLAIVKPDENIDRKLIVINPCVSKTEQPSNSEIPALTAPNNNPKSPVTKLKYVQSNFSSALKFK